MFLRSVLCGIKTKIGVKNIISVPQQNRLRYYNHGVRQDGHDWAKRHMGYEWMGYVDIRPTGRPNKNIEAVIYTALHLCGPYYRTMPSVCPSFLFRPLRPEWKVVRTSNPVHIYSLVPVMDIPIFTVHMGRINVRINASLFAFQCIWRLRSQCAAALATTVFMLRLTSKHTECAAARTAACRSVLLK